MFDILSNPYICAYVHVLFIPSCIVQYFQMKYWTIVGTTLFTQWFIHLQVYLERLNNSTVDHAVTTKYCVLNVTFAV